MIDALWSPALYMLTCYSLFFLVAAALFVAVVRESRRHARRMRCRVCGQTTVHQFVGVQVFPGQGTLRLYNCRCGATRSEVVR